MFTLKADATFQWPVKAKVPEEGKYKAVNFTATFKVLSQKDITRLTEGGPVSENSQRVLDEAIVTFEGIDIAEEDGEKVTDDDRRKEIILQHPYMVSALSEAFSSGIAGYRIKN